MDMPSRAFCRSMVDTEPKSFIVAEVRRSFRASPSKLILGAINDRKDRSSNV